MNSSKDKLIWFEKYGIGYYHVKESPYDEDYWNKYVEYEKTEFGKKLNQARVDIVNKYRWSALIDIGIGSGAFIKEFENAFGFDINPVAVKWLKEEKKFSEPRKVDAMTFWDSLEHIHNAEPILNNIKNYAFVSCPIYKDREHIFRSKHFRPDEHCWYFTDLGIVNFMGNYGFTLIESSNIESKLGREDIKSYVFRKL